MKKSFKRVILWTGFLLCLWAPSALAKLPALEDVPDQLSEEKRTELNGQKAALAAELAAFRADGDAFSAKDAEAQTDAEFAELQARQKRYVDGAIAFNDRVATAAGEHAIRSLSALARELGWSEDEQKRLDTALNSLDEDGGASTGAERVQVWKDVLARDSEAFAKEASGGQGPGFPGAGTQSFEDCAVYALANASGTPYEVVAARATKLIEEGNQRGASERIDAQKTIEDAGLTGGEVIMLAESLGEAEVVQSEDFEKTLREGRPVMVNVISTDGRLGSAHEVVLTKTFQREGKTWYEMMDSNRDERRRLYWSASELDLILKETGVAFRPDAGTVPQLLRKNGE